MELDVNGSKLWFDVNGPSLVPSASGMVERPTVILLHGGPGSFDHSYLKPAFSSLTSYAQVVYVDLRGHGRSEWGDASEWSFETCAEDVHSLCDLLGISNPIVLGHSMGGFIAILYAARHPDQPAGLILQSTMARFDETRLIDGFTRIAGPAIAEMARKDYAGEASDAEAWSKVFAIFGPNVPDQQELDRRIQNPAVNERGMHLFRHLDLIEILGAIRCPTLVCTGELDPITPPTAAEEIMEGLNAGVGRLSIIEGAGHFPWKDAPAEYARILRDFIDKL